MTVTQLGKLRTATDDAIRAIQAGPNRPKGAINWGDLHCVQAAWVLTDNYCEAYAEVTIEEASPEEAEFRQAVAAKLAESGWPNVRVVTEW